MADGPVRGDAAASEFEEIRLVDVARVLYRRRVVLAVTLVVALVAGGAVTFFTQPVYEASASVLPVTAGPIIKQWFSSRQAAEMAVDELGARLYPVLYPTDWDAASQTWKTGAPTRAAVALALQTHVRATAGASAGANADPSIVVTVSMPDALLARDVAAAYLSSLDGLRPQLENITKAELFKQFYDGKNAQEAQARAETGAHAQTYWIVFDSPNLPVTPVKPRPVLNMALAAVLGIVLAILLVFSLEWLGRYRTEFARVETFTEEPAGPRAIPGGPPPRRGTTEFAPVDSPPQQGASRPGSPP